MRTNDSKTGSTPVFGPEWINDIVDNVAALLSGTSGTSLKEDTQRNVRAVIQSAFSKLDIVSREEFDAQVAVLHRTREKVDALEHQLAELTRQLNT